MKRLSLFLSVALTLAVIVLSGHSNLRASGSGEDPPTGGQPEDAVEETEWKDEEKAVDSAEVARELYNDGVKKMDRAKEYWTEAKSDKDREKAIKWFEKAADKYAEALKYRGDYPEALNNLGFSVRLSGRYEEALAHYSKAIALRPDFMEPHEYRGRAYLAMDSVVQAQSEYTWLNEHKHTAEAESLKAAIDAWVLAKAEGKKVSVEKIGW